MDNWLGIDSFVAVAETSSFTKAAARLGVSISRVSRDVAQLETRLGTALLARTTRRVTLTEAGRILEIRCHQLIRDREAAFAAVAHTPDEAVAGHIRLTCAVAYGERTVVPLVNRFLTRNRSVTVDIVLSNHVLDIVAEGIDLAIRIGETGDVRLRQVLLGSRSLHLVASPTYLADRKVLSDVGDLTEHDGLLGTAERWRFSQAGKVTEVRPNTRWHCNSGFAVLDAALQGLGMCQLPDFYVTPHLESGALVELLVHQKPPDQRIWAVSQARHHPQARVQALVAFIQSELRPPDGEVDAAA